MAMEQLVMEAEQLSNEATQSLPVPSNLWDSSLKTLEKLGGFVLIESLINGVRNIDPARKSRRESFLGESENKSERAALKKTLQLWTEVLSSSDDPAHMMQKCMKESEDAGQLLKKNLKAALKETHDLEVSYRSTDLLFKNTGSQKVKNISFINAHPEQLKDLDNPIFINAIQNELTDKFDRLDLRENYSLLVIPGYLGSNKVVEKWAKIAHENKVMLITDFLNLEAPDDLMESFEKANLTGPDIYRSNVIITANWLIARGKYDEVGEEEDLHIPPSAALAGKIYNTLLSQVAAGNKHGCLNEVDDVRFDLKKKEIGFLVELGLIPMVKEFGKVMAFSAKTLFNGDNLGLQTYSVVRVFDHIAKVMMHFLNQITFQNFTPDTKNELNRKIVKYLDSVSGHNKLIESFSIKRLEQDPNQKDMVHLEIQITPYFPTTVYMISLVGQNGDNGTNDYQTKYEVKDK